MPTPGLYPVFLKAASGSTTLTVEAITMQLELQPTVVLDPELTIMLDEPTLSVVLDPEIDIEVD